MNHLLGGLICVFKWHKLDDSQEIILYNEFSLPGEKWHTVCSRCGMGLVCYIEPKHPDVYCMKEEY